MSQGAAVFLGEKLDREKQDKQESKVEILIEHVPPQDSPEAPGQDSSAIATAIDVSERFMPALIGELVLRMQEIGEQYAATIDAATKQLLDRVEVSTRHGAGNNAAMRHKIASARDEFAGKVLEAAGLLNTQRQMVVEQVQALERQGSSAIQEKITQTETAVGLEEIRIQKMVEDVTLDIPVLMRANAAHKEFKAYLEGLKFR